MWFRVIAACFVNTMTSRVDINPRLITWARERAGFSLGHPVSSFVNLQSWESGEVKPTFKQLEKFAKSVYAPIGYFFLPEPPPEEELPIVDLRTISSRGVSKPSINLLDTIYLCQQRQEWYRDFSLKAGEPPVKLVGSVSHEDNVKKVAAIIKKTLAIDSREWQAQKSWKEAFVYFIDKIEALGVLVMVNGVVGVNTRRNLDSSEFRGFSLADDMAPLVFVNGADAKAAQMFTLAHELAHIWLGKSTLSDVSITSNNRIEKWCNKVAAELLVPEDIIREKYNENNDDLADQIRGLSNYFKVSTLVILYRLYDAKIISRGKFRIAYEEEVEKFRNMPNKSGGNFYSTLKYRASKRFIRAIVESTFEGNSSFTEAFNLLGVKKVDSLKKIGEKVGMVI